MKKEEGQTKKDDNNVNPELSSKTKAQSFFLWISFRWRGREIESKFWFFSPEVANTAEKFRKFPNFWRKSPNIAEFLAETLNIAKILKSGSISQKMANFGPIAHVRYWTTPRTRGKIKAYWRAGTAPWWHDFSHNPRQRPTFSSPPYARIEALGFKDVSQQGYRDKIDMEDLSDDVDWRSKMNSVFWGFWLVCLFDWTAAVFRGFFLRSRFELLVHFCDQRSQYFLWRLKNFWTMLIG